MHRAIISEIYGSSGERGCLYGFDTNEFGETTIEIIAWRVQTAIGARPRNCRPHKVLTNCRVVRPRKH